MIQCENDIKNLKQTLAETREDEKKKREESENNAVRLNSSQTLFWGYFPRETKISRQRTIVLIHPADTYFGRD